MLRFAQHDSLRLARVTYLRDATLVARGQESAGRQIRPLTGWRDAAVGRFRRLEPPRGQTIFGTLGVAERNT